MTELRHNVLGVDDTIIEIPLPSEIQMPVLTLSFTLYVEILTHSSGGQHILTRN